MYRATAERLAAIAPEIDYLLTAHNVPVASGDYLVKMDAAFEEVSSGDGTYAETDGAFEYAFEGFSVIVPAKDH